MSTLLKIVDLEIIYGSALAVRGVNIELKKGEIQAILGPNGAGKSSIINAIMGLVRPHRGRIEFPVGREIQKIPAHKVNQMGIALVPEGRQVFSTLSVRENLLMGAFALGESQSVKKSMEEIMGLFPRLRNRQEQLAGSLSGGEQQMLAIGRALMCRPTLLLMDEPSLGLAPKLVQGVFSLMSRLRDDGISILVADQNARQALKVADFAYLLKEGEFRGSGSAQEMEGKEEVRRVYLGG